jgi:predicted Zn-ribbon and HTH transcriptional regulator
MKWLTLGLCLLTFAAMAASGPRTIYYEAHGWGFRLDEGILTAHWGFPSESVPPGRGLYGWNFRPMTTRLGFRLLFPRLESWPDGRTILYLGVWILLVPLSAATALLWWLGRRRIPPGHCRRCGYNLTANTSGRCPECGTTCASGQGKAVTMPEQSRVRRILGWKIIDEGGIAVLQPLLKRCDGKACKEYPELTRVPDLSLRSQIRKCARRRSLTLGTVLRTVAISLIAAVAMWLAPMFFQAYWKPTTLQQVLSGVLAFLTFNLLLLAIISWSAGHINDKRYRRALRIELTGAGFPTCEQCGYDLTGNLSGICPECGTACDIKQPSITQDRLQV